MGNDSSSSSGGNDNNSGSSSSDTSGWEGPPFSLPDSGDNSSSNDRSGANDDRPQANCYNAVPKSDPPNLLDRPLYIPCGPLAPLGSHGANIAAQVGKDLAWASGTNKTSDKPTTAPTKCTLPNSK